MIGNLPDKDLAMLEERIKRATKTRQVHTDPWGLADCCTLNCKVVSQVQAVPVLSLVQVVSQVQAVAAPPPQQQEQDRVRIGLPRTVFLCMPLRHKSLKVNSSVLRELYSPESDDCIPLALTAPCIPCPGDDDDQAQDGQWHEAAHCCQRWGSHRWRSRGGGHSSRPVVMASRAPSALPASPDLPKDHFASHPITTILIYNLFCCFSCSSDVDEDVTCPDVNVDKTFPMLT